MAAQKDVGLRDQAARLKDPLFRGSVSPGEGSVGPRPPLLHLLLMGLSIHSPAVTPLSFSLSLCHRCNLPAFHFSSLGRLMSPGRTCPTASPSTCGASGKETGSERRRCRGKIASNGAAFFNLNLVFSSLLLLSAAYGLLFFQICLFDKGSAHGLMTVNVSNCIRMYKALVLRKQ